MTDYFEIIKSIMTQKPFKIEQRKKKLEDIDGYIQWLESELLPNGINGMDHYRCVECDRVNYCADMIEDDLGEYRCKDCDSRIFEKIIKVP